MQTKRIFLLSALAFVGFIILQQWMNFSQEKFAQQFANRGDVVNADTPQAVRDAEVPQAATDSVSAAPVAQSQNDDAISSEKIQIKTDVIDVQIDTKGGDLVYLGLLDYPTSLKTLDDPYVLLSNQTREDVFVVQNGLFGAPGQSYPNHTVQYEFAQSDYTLAADANTLEVPLTWTGDNGVTYEKIYRFQRGSYRVEIEYRVRNDSTTPWTGYIYGQIKQTEVIEDTGLGFIGRLPSYRGAVIYTNENKYEKISYGNMVDENFSANTNTGWIAMIEHYFVVAMIPEGSASYEFYSGVSQDPVSPQYRIAYKSQQPVQIAPGEQGVLKNALFLGPKDQEMLDAQNVEGLKLTVDYGWLTVIATPLFWLLNQIHNIVQNWGFAIILLTLLIKLVFFPLSAKSYKSMAKMRKLQPRLQTLKERYGDDRQKFQQEMMKLYKTEKVNPAGGCLPILVQIPVFIALYWVLLESVELRQAPFILWIKDLSIRDPYFILPLLMGVSMFVQQKLNPAPLDPMQQKIMTYLPVVFTIFFVLFPAGLVLYWVVNNCLSIAQQYFITRKYAD